MTRTRQRSFEYIRTFEYVKTARVKALGHEVGLRAETRQRVGQDVQLQWEGAGVSQGVVS